MMKRKVIFGALAALFLGGGIVTSVNLTQKEQVSDLTLANIEAMTIPKDDDVIKLPCPYDGEKCFFPCDRGDGVIMMCSAPGREG